MSKLILEDLIAQLNGKQIRQIRNVLAQRVGESDQQESPGRNKKSSRERSEVNKSLRMFNMMTSGVAYTRKDFIDQLFKTKVTRNALDGIRKRLTKTILDELFTELVTDEKEFKVGRIFGMILLAFKLSGQRAKTVMNYYLNRAKEMAKEQQLYNVLDGIYDLQEQYAVMLGLNLEEIVKERNINDLYYYKMRNVKRALTEIQLAADKARRTLVFPDLQTVIDEALKSQQITAEDTDNPAIQVRIMNIFRTAYMFSKAYYKLEPLLIERYNALKKREAFKGSDRDHELSFLYMISHVYFRTGKFQLAFEWLEKLKEKILTAVNEKHIYALKYKALLAGLYSATGKNEEAIATLEEALKRRPKSNEMTEWLNMELSLAVYYFEGKNYRKCIRTIHTISSYDIDLKEEMSKEWCFKMDLICVLAHYEKEDVETALRLIHKMKKTTYKKFLTNEKYEYANTFITYITKVITNKEIVHNKKFRQELKEVAEKWEKTQGHDLQAVRFFCWLKSKMHGRDYYELLVEELSGKAEERK